ncbi:MAG: hypothetical protein OEM00_06250 [Burkholderiaceae bacterium]|nr:hypothetical protein [Burkholderiaceae bacterium]MDH3460570.1 hypothetical protein [Burkholderiaceae bacterium]
MRRTEIERLLPEVFRTTIADRSPLGALVDVMEDLHAPTENILGRLDGFFSPNRTEDRFVALLSRWAGLEHLFAHSALRSSAAAEREPISTGLGRLRELIARAAYLSQWRGTARGLIAFLETATGASGFRVDELVKDQSGAVRPFHVRVFAPSAMTAHRPLIERIIEFEKPAYVTYEVQIEA